MDAKHEKIIVAMGKLNILKKAISELSKEEKEFQAAMQKLPSIQKLPMHCYVYIPAEYKVIVKEKFNRIHYEKYGYVD